MKNAVSLFAVLAVTASVPAFSQNTTVNFDQGVNSKAVLATARATVASNDSTVPVVSQPVVVAKDNANQSAAKTMQPISDNDMNFYLRALGTFGQNPDEIGRLLTSGSCADKEVFLAQHANGMIIIHESTPPETITRGSLNVCTNWVDTQVCSNQQICQVVCAAAGGAAGPFVGGAGTGAGIGIATQVCKNVCSSVPQCSPSRK